MIHHHQLISRPSVGDRQRASVAEPPTSSLLMKARREQPWGVRPTFGPNIRGYIRKRSWSPKLCSLGIRRLQLTLIRK